LLLVIPVLLLPIPILPSVLRWIALLLVISVLLLRVSLLLPFFLRWIALLLVIPVLRLPIRLLFFDLRRIALLVRISLLLSIRLLRLSGLLRHFHRLPAMLAKARAFREWLGTILTNHGSFRQETVLTFLPSYLLVSLKVLATIFCAFSTEP